MMAAASRTPRSTRTAAATNDPDLELAARLRVAIARLGRQLRQQAGTPLTPTLQSVLASIALHGPLSLGDLAVREQVAPPTITKLLGRLDELGLIERQRGADDRRVILVSLSEAGRRQFEESRHRRTAWLEQRLRQLDGLDQAQLTQAVELLEAIIGAPAAAPPSSPGPGPAPDPAPGAAAEPSPSPEPTPVTAPSPAPARPPTLLRR